MNKVIVMDNKNLVNGSTALAPRVKPYEPNKNDEYERLREANREKKKQLAQARAKAKTQAIGVIILILVVGTALIGRYAAVYNLQKNLSKVKSDIHSISMENENLKVELIKASNMQVVEDTAKTKLNMVTPDKSNVLYTIEATKDYFAKNTKDNKSNIEGNLVAKIKNMLF